MTTGVFCVPKSVIVDRELRCQGTSLENWAKAHSVGFTDLCHRINQGSPDDALVYELAETLGVSVTALQPTGT